MATTNTIAKKIIKVLTEGQFEKLYADAERIWKDAYEVDDNSIRLLVNCLKNCKEEDRYGYALALVNNINSLYSTGVKYIHIHKVAENVVDALFGNEEDKIGKIAGRYEYSSEDGEHINIYFSFATKLCAFYYDNEYVIYDSYLDAFVWEYISENNLLDKSGERIYHYSFDSSSTEPSSRYVNYVSAWEVVFDSIVENYAKPAGIDMTKKNFDKMIWALMKHWN